MLSKFENKSTEHHDHHCCNDCIHGLAKIGWAEWTQETRPTELWGRSSQYVGEVNLNTVVKDMCRVKVSEKELICFGPEKPFSGWRAAGPGKDLTFRRCLCMKSSLTVCLSHKKDGSWIERLIGLLSFYSKTRRCAGYMNIEFKNNLLFPVWFRSKMWNLENPWKTLGLKTWLNTCFGSIGQHVLLLNKFIDVWKYLETPWSWSWSIQAVKGKCLYMQEGSCAQRVKIIVWMDVVGIIYLTTLPDMDRVSLMLHCVYNVH